MAYYLAILYLKLMIEKSEAVTPDPSSVRAIDSQETNSDLNKILKINKVSEKYDECKKYYTTNNISEVNYSECIWSGVYSTDKTQIITGIDSKTKEQVQEVLKGLQTIKGNKETGVPDKLDLTLENSNVVSTYSSHPGYQKLYELIGKKLRKAMGYTDDKSDTKNIIAIDHSTFNGLYKAEISKGIVDALSNYCMRVDYSEEIVNKSCLANCESSKKILNKEKDCTSFCTFYTYKNSEEKNNSEEILNAINSGEESVTRKNGQVVKLGIDRCMVSVDAACTDINYDGYNPTAENSNAKKLACITGDYLNSSRKNLILNDKILKVYDETSASKTSSLEIKNLKKQGDINKEKTVTITSDDIEKSYKQANKDLLDISEACAKNPNNPDCNKLLDTNRNEKIESVTELGLRKIAQEKNLEKELDNKETLTTYLKSEGKDDKQIQELLSDDKRIEDIKGEILEKFRAKKGAIVAEISDRVKNTTSVNDKEITSADAEKFKNLSDSLNQKTETMKSLVRFNNIVSSYLVIQNSGDPKDRNPASTKSNTVSLREEIENSNENKESNEKIKRAFKDKLDNSNTGTGMLNIFQTLQDILGI